MDLTETGDLVFGYTSRMFEGYEEMRRAMVLAEKEVRGPLNVATVNSIGIYLLPRILTSYHHEFPDVKINLQLVSSHRVMELLQDNQVDLALIAWDRQYPLLESSVIMQNRLVLAAHPKHPLARKRTLTVADLVGEGFVGYEAGTPTRIMIDAHFKGMGIPLEYVLESGNIATIKQLVVSGMGLALLPEFAVELEVKEKLLKVLPLADAQIERPVTVYWKERRVLSRPAQKFLDRLKKGIGSATAKKTRTASSGKA